ncbi:unnamed protein product [Vitrella brassicaformis CCMP3155]|uniref:Uncharacterized protein n=1 Tax=Vitrella brassicaformis (strain CCMP3155) TaxID=1169540 RepID=A0A0G4EH14_VITBC|nr:unnamed protein product [Vitrella brassicaformis CCMP3155]|mmetsp:Transcript_45549/g.113122  ORF Transcript_45549/g.113122 Transcript_45549/m.113122 type:complete len:135 (-) Transcript_45549:543-947(-)|eukprot:CEL94659.1 unnamed protein product [Vitrella brassicaformis CCMP3155]
MSDEDDVTIESIEISPNECPLESPLHLSIAFRSKRAFTAARWKITYTVDTVHTRKVIYLGETDAADYSVGSNVMTFSVDQISTEGIPKDVLANIGLLAATLMEGDKEVLAVNMVTQVRAEANGSLSRVIFSPLE